MKEAESEERETKRGRQRSEEVLLCLSKLRKIAMSQGTQAVSRK